MTETTQPEVHISPGMLISIGARSEMSITLGRTDPLEDDDDLLKSIAWDYAIGFPGVPGVIIGIYVDEKKNKWACVLINNKIRWFRDISIDPFELLYSTKKKRKRSKR